MSFEYLRFLGGSARRLDNIRILEKRCCTQSEAESWFAPFMKFTFCHYADSLRQSYRSCHRPLQAV